MVARSPSPHGGRRAQNRKRLPAHAVVEAPPRGRAHLPRFRDRGGRRPLSRDGGRGPGARGGAHADRDARARRGFPSSLRADQPSGHGVGRRDGERYELATRAFGARGGARTPAARRRARDPLLAPVSTRPSPCEPAPGALLPGRGDDGVARVAVLGDGSGEAPDPGRAAPLFRAPLLDDGACAGDGGHGGRDGRLGRGDRVRPAGRGAGRARSGRGELRRGDAHRGAPRRAWEHRTRGRGPPPTLRGPRREGDPGGLRPAAGVVLPASGPTPWAAGTEGVRVGRSGGVSGTVVRAAQGPG